MLWRALRDVTRGFYIDVGAQSPDFDSVTRAFSLAGWRGINVEPHPFYLQQLRERRTADINLGIAIGDRVGRITMNLVDDTGLSTANAEFARQHAAAGLAIRPHEVDVQTLTQVWQDHVSAGQEVHFLKVDVEGLEHAVLAGNDWLRYRPWIVLVEAMLPNQQVECHQEWEPVLGAAGYQFVYADGLNRFYVASERQPLAEAFRYPPNVFDGFVPVALDRAEHECRRLSAELPLVHEQLALTGRRADSLDRTLEGAQAQLAQTTMNLEKAQVQLAQIDAVLKESHARVECAEVALIQSRERAMVLQDLVESERTAHHEDLQAHVQRLAVAEQERNAMVQSPWWRLTAPGRRLMGAMSPASRRNARRALKAAWWLATPWKLAARIRALRDRVDTGRRGVLNLYPLNEPSRAAEPALRAPPRRVRDRVTAARWCTSVLRGQSDIRARFPRALSGPEEGFETWVLGEGGERFGLSAGERSTVVATLRDDFGKRAREYLHARPDVLTQIPNALEAGGQEAVYRWFMRHGCDEGGLTQEEVVWLLMSQIEVQDFGGKHGV